MDLTEEQMANIDRIIEETVPEGDYVFNGEDSLWEDDAKATLVQAARRVRHYLQCIKEGTAR